jgi:adenylate cyclase
MESRTLIIEEPDGSKRIIPVEKTVMNLGRSADNDIVLTDPELRISRRHATLEFDEAGATIRDAGSVNGTYINDVRVEGSARIKNRDVIYVGGHRIEFRADKDEKLPWSVETGGTDLDVLQNVLTNPKIDTAALQESALDKLETLYQVGIALARTQTIPEVTDNAVQLLFKIDGVQRATLWLWNPKDNCFNQSPLVSRGQGIDLPGTFDPRNVVLSTTILNHVRSQNRAMLIRDVQTSKFSAAESIMRAGIQAAFCAPLMSQGSFLGVLYADNLEQADAFGAEDFRTFTVIAAQVGMALANALARAELANKLAEHASLRAYLAPQVLDMITNNGGTLALGGVLQPVTVLFADIRGFTQLSEKMDAREVVDLLNEVFTIMTAEIFETDGTLDKFIGDAVMALFGAPIPSDRSPKQGLLAAVRIQTQISRLNQERVQRGEAPVRVGIGLHHGLAVVGNIGSLQRMQYTAIGDTVNVAARLVGRAEPDQILISEAMYQAAGVSHFFEDLGLFSVKGRDGKLHVYSVDWPLIAGRIRTAAVT